MIGLLRYHAAVLSRSYRWVAPLLLFAFLLSGATTGGPPAADAFGYTGALLVATVAWLARICLTLEPDQSRACVITAGGAVRVHLSALALSALAGLGLAAATAPLLLARARSGTGVQPLPSVPAVLTAGLLTEVACVLVGVAAGAAISLTGLRAPGVAVLATGGLIVLALAVPVSPAAAAIRTLASGSTGPSVRLPVPELLAAAVLAGLLAAASSLVSRARGGG